MPEVTIRAIMLQIGDMITPNLRGGRRIVGLKVFDHDHETWVTATLLDTSRITYRWSDQVQVAGKERT